MEQDAAFCISRVGVEAAQAVIGHDAVLVDNWNDVGGNGHSNEVEHTFKVALVDAVAA